MTLYFRSTKNTTIVTLAKALIAGQAPDRGLYVPVQIPVVPQDFIASMSQMSDLEIVRELSVQWLFGSVDEHVARKIAEEAINFVTPLVKLDNVTHILELFHGPTFAFKDYGARYMARLLSHFLEEQNKEQIILVATSGDTGSAVASGFLALKNIRVVVLYPSKRVSRLQELQMTTLGSNVTALEVDGSFDDCQRLVKSALADSELSKHNLNSANSINIARLIAQSFYYFIAYARLFRQNIAPVFAVPSGNLGNLTAGVYAKKMGLPVHTFIAGMNANDVFVEYLKEGKLYTRPSIPTISSAMDVGNPSNFERLISYYENNITQMRQEITAFTVTDTKTRETMRAVNDKYSYIIDPHTAVAFESLRQWRVNQGDKERPCVVLSTAHPSKFKHDVEAALQRQIVMPEALSNLENRAKKSIPMQKNFEVFKKWILQF